MTIKELIERLSKYDPDTRVCIMSYDYEPMNITCLDMSEYDFEGDGSEEEYVYIVR